MKSIEKYLDHTALKADTRLGDIEKLVKEAIEYNFYAVCVNGAYVEKAKELLKDTEVKVAAVVGFPLGASTTETKVFETENAIMKGAEEIDMVINISALKDGFHNYVFNDIKAVVDIAKGKAAVKVIIETALLSDDEKIKVCELAKEAKADFVKTSTGFSTAGATKEDVALMKKTVGPDVEVKASGGIRDFAKAKEMIAAGATRIGASASVDIVEEFEKEQKSK
ncbi:deoxyribose-phosphate aldolase [Isachenkonia alkalipeptolytica]|uniref:Deoxyribose-phosphate aldolase n=1 Tax=Isachenkonia alkalipeptolytica TaxID=2565777 RepID=A0AA43XKD5_9CLOT|nr:deoxyribose-phosphate aldolase [Isachenkonia alkalipeptolytica]NBG88510.1 deoxyribose-phosphate aldolase [Isachenkonia alkalipeptolytica]